MPDEPIITESYNHDDEAEQLVLSATDRTEFRNYSEDGLYITDYGFESVDVGLRVRYVQDLRAVDELGNLGCLAVS